MTDKLSELPVHFKKWSYALLMAGVLALFALAAIDEVIRTHTTVGRSVNLILAVAFLLLSYRSLLSASIVLAGNVLTMRTILHTIRMPAEDILAFEVVEGRVGLYRRGFLRAKLRGGGEREFPSLSERIARTADQTRESKLTTTAQLLNRALQVSASSDPEAFVAAPIDAEGPAHISGS